MLDHVLGMQQVVQARELAAGGRPRDLDLLRFRRVIQLDQKHEPVKLGFRQRVCPLLLYRVLRGENEKRRRKLERLAHDRDILLLHRLEHGRLGFRWGAVDLVGEYDVGEHRAVHELELSAAARGILQDIGAGDVHRHQVGRELDAAELERHRLGELADQERLRQPRHTHEQSVPACKEADREPLDHVVLADNHAAELFPKPRIDVAKPVDGLNVVVAQANLRTGKDRLRHGLAPEGSSGPPGGRTRSGRPRFVQGTRTVTLYLRFS